ncbi:hypothetical protein YC2023_100504 [Brassica napus]
MFKVRTTTSPCSTSTRMYRSPPAHGESRAQPSFLWISSNPSTYLLEERRLQSFRKVLSNNCNDGGNVQESNFICIE